MNNIPSVWRTELWHPLVVHLPIVTLLLASAAGLLRLAVTRPSRKQFLSQLTGLMLVLGVAGSWLGILTGQYAYNIEVRKLCDPEVLQDHQWWSYVAAIVYSVALLLLLLSRQLPGIQLLKPLFAVFLIAGACALLYSGHLGASVVYQQGGGTYQPSENCREFEKP